jgi:hypothetical protein
MNQNCMPPAFASYMISGLQSSVFDIIMMWASIPLEAP